MIITAENTAVKYERYGRPVEEIIPTQQMYGC